MSNVYVKNINSSYRDDVYSMIDGEFYSSGELFIGLFDGDKIIGSILLDKDYLPWEYRFDIIIDKRYRNKGCSNILIKEIIKKFKKDKDADNLIAWVVNDGLKNMLVKKYGFDTLRFDGEDFVGLQKDNLQEVRKIIKNVLLETSSKPIKKLDKCVNKDIPKNVIEYISKFRTDEELLRSGGFPVDMLDKWAFGFTEGEVKKLKPEQLKIRWHEDLDNVKWEIDNTIWEKNNEEGTKENWAKHIDLSEPIDVSYLENKEEGLKRGFYIEDGHHRYYAAKILGKPLNVNLQIKVNPIKELSDLGYDDFHRCVFNKARGLNENYNDVAEKLWNQNNREFGNINEVRGFVRKILNETFTFGDLDDFGKEDLSNELHYYEDEYEFLSEVSGEIKKIVNESINEFKNHIQMFNNIHIQFVENLSDNALGMYVNESVLRVPVILLSKKEIYEAAKDGYGLETIIKATIFHELGHAMVDVDNNFEFVKDRNILNFMDEEDYVEDFAFNLFTHNTVDDDFIELNKLFIEKLKNL